MPESRTRLRYRNTVDWSQVCQKTSGSGQSDRVRPQNTGPLQFVERVSACYKRHIDKSRSRLLCVTTNTHCGISFFGRRRLLSSMLRYVNSFPLFTHPPLRQGSTPFFVITVITLSYIYITSIANRTTLLNAREKYTQRLTSCFMLHAHIPVQHISYLYNIATCVISLVSFIQPASFPRILGDPVISPLIVIGTGRALVRCSDVTTCWPWP